MDKWITFIKAHERLVLGLAILALVLYLGNKYINASADQAIARAAAAQQALDTIKQQNADLQKKVDEQSAQYAELLAQLTKQNQSLLASIQSRREAVQQQQTVDASLPLPQLASRWIDLAKLKLDAIKSTENGLQITPEGAVTTVQALELVPVLQQNLADTEKIVANKDQQISGLNGLVETLNAQVSGLNAQLKAADVAHKTEIDSLKAQQRKKSRNWFLRGLVVGGTIVGYILR